MSLCLWPQAAFQGAEAQIVKVGQRRNPGKWQRIIKCVRRVQSIYLLHETFNVDSCSSSNSLDVITIYRGSCWALYSRCTAQCMVILSIFWLLSVYAWGAAWTTDSAFAPWAVATCGERGSWPVRCASMLTSISTAVQIVLSRNTRCL